jgi:uncharacterized protein with NAD-binding domain and iron-sulfur cluster
MIDNALHVFFPYYVNLINFFKKMEIYENIIWRKPEFSHMLPRGKEAILHFPALPSPLHAAGAFLSLFRSYDAVPRWKMLSPAR